MFTMFALSILLATLCGVYGDIIVDTTHGPALGYSLNLSQSQSIPGQVDGLNVFLGIPFAEPPTGNLRFARPVPKRSWAPNVISAKTMPPICPQVLGPIRR